MLFSGFQVINPGCCTVAAARTVEARTTNLLLWQLP
jgi:hypothetical protein